MLLLVTCEDTGCGIVEEDHELVFHAFTRVRMLNNPVLDRCWPRQCRMWTIRKI